MEPIYLSIQPAETGKRIKQLLLEQGYTIRDIQGAFGFEIRRQFINESPESHYQAWTTLLS